MQEQETSKTASWAARFGWANLIWSSLCAAMLLAAAIVWLCPYASLPTSSRREAESNLPWEMPTLRVENLTACWKACGDNARMALRAAYYPAAELELGEATGSGMLYICFTDSEGHQVADTITLSYKDGAFLPRKDVNIDTKGNKASVYIEAGYQTEGEFRLHEADTAAPLWRVNILCRPDGEADVLPVGSITIPAEAV